ncbi:MAG: MBL fold metallo-hydrolase [Ruminococcaceae bacterium]|jgi:7,8-dihydropterin-6-yl-methyl-4-(beta-D-ribofuranosyl)aminobenzene 5'-phosphate synthase|nr:MBL fold metallo-hydrolase [Oscillospiraceae bacterium]
MKLTILTDNTTRIDAYYLGEPGVSYYLEDEGRRILFDTGYSDVYVRNAAAMGIDLSAVDTVVLSHGHDDHTGGLVHLPPPVARPRLYAHPDVFLPRRWGGQSIGAPWTEEQAAERFDLRLTAEPAEVTPRLIFLGQIPRTQPFEPDRAIGERLTDGGWQPDCLPDDSALVYRGEEGLTVITGCSHAGICNIIEQAIRVCGDERIAGVIGGFHLLELSDRVRGTAAYLRRRHPRRLCPCHCTCFAARAAIHSAVPVEEVCVGDMLEIR